MAVWLNLIPQLHQPGDDDVSMRHHHFHEREPHYYAGMLYNSKLNLLFYPSVPTFLYTAAALLHLSTKTPFVT
jgi:hypothetical protein